MRTKFLLLTAFLTIICLNAFAQEKAKPAPKSPRDSVSQTISSGATVTINYGAPGLNGRKVGVDVEPMDGKVWRAGANTATTFEVNKDVKVEGQSLPAGKYAMFVLKEANEWTIIFNKQWKTWGAFDYEKNKGDDVLKVKATAGQVSPGARLNYTIDKGGRVSLNWGGYIVSFNVK